MHIDHHLQLSLVKELARSTEPVIYTDLKPGDIDNSLFSYHINKLIDQKMVEKTSNGYSLTVEGARWLHFNAFMSPIKDNPRVYVSLVVQDEDGNYLIGQRTGQLKVLINDYTLPGFYYKNDCDLAKQIDDVIKTYIPQSNFIRQIEFGVVQFKVSYKDKTLDSLSSITLVRVKAFEPLKLLATVDFEWYSKMRIEAIDHPSAEILRQIFKYTDNPKSQHATPLFSNK